MSLCLVFDPRTFKKVKKKKIVMEGKGRRGRNKNARRKERQTK